MKTLGSNWITEGLLDFEYKKYILLAYLKHCNESFVEAKLYPPMAELAEHYASLLSLKRNVEEIKGQFPKELEAIDLQQAQLHWQRNLPHDASMSTVTEILEFAIPGMKQTLDEGKLIYEFVEKNIELCPVGLMPVNNSEGFLLLHEEPQPDVFIYQYKMSMISVTSETYRSLAVEYVSSEKKSIANSFEQIKLNLLKKFRSWPNPATFLCLSRFQFPLTETFLPVSKRVLLKNIAASTL
ncbi:MAG: hypothetical protein SH856_06420 [Flavobacteriales bacterium]|nr:hypothetical protein [Flavobacteriales bacterium]